NKNQLNPQVLAALEEVKRRSDGASETRPCRLKLVANLPYSVATPVIGNLLTSDTALERMVVTVQWEIAERLTATPGTKPYGALRGVEQGGAAVALVRGLPPWVFGPRPGGGPAIVFIRPTPARGARVGAVQRSRRFLRALYVHRRKNLRGA